MWSMSTQKWQNFIELANNVFNMKFPELSINNVCQVGSSNYRSGELTRLIRVAQAPLFAQDIRFMWRITAGNRDEFLRRQNYARIDTGDNVYKVVYHLFTRDIIANFEAFGEGLGVECKTVSQRLMETPRHKFRIYYNAEEKIVYILDSRRENVDGRVCAVLAALPAIVGIDLEKLNIPYKLFSLLANNTSESQAEYETLWESYMNASEFQKQVWVNHVQNVLRHKQRQSVDRYASAKRQAEATVQEMWAEYKRALETAQAAAYAFHSAKDNPQGEGHLLDFISKMEDVQHLSTNSGNLTIQFATPLAAPDTHFLSRAFGSGDTTINRAIASGARDNGLNEVAFHRMIRKILQKQDYTLYFNGKFEITAENIGRMSVESSEFGMNNPHIYQFNCWSQALDKIRDALRNKNDEVLALSYLIAAVADLNVADNTVIGRTISLASEYSRMRVAPRCIRDMQGKELTWREVYEIEKNILDRESEAGVDLAAESANDTTLRAV